MRVAVLTNAPASYRAPLFEAMARADDVELRVFFDAASRSTTRATSLHFPHEELPPGLALQRRNYQDGAGEAERVRVRFGWHYGPRLSAFRPDVLISGEFGWRTLQAAAYATLTGIPLLIWWEGTPHTERHAGALRRGLRRVLAARAKGLLGFGSGSIAYLRALAPAARLHFVPQAVDNARIARETDAWRARREGLRAQLGLRGKVLLCVGNLHPPKGTPQLLDALLRLHASAPAGAWSALLVGDGPQRADAERAAQHLSGALRVIGAVPPADIPRYLAASDVLVLPTLRDCWGMVVNEALAAGLPVLGSRYAGASDELLGSGAGRIFDPLDADDFDRALRAALLEDCFRDLDVGTARRAVARHTCDEAARALLDAARDALAGDRVPSPA